MAAAANHYAGKKDYPKVVYGWDAEANDGKGKGISKTVATKREHDALDGDWHEHPSDAEPKKAKAEKGKPGPKPKADADLS